ncbi:pectinesterase-like [Phragmites australis]|uniref:pectinesterase-like n=1 Tax=Phragmites australis TaxID=29695 RepID=UPI002D785DE1|nr:pectinesterase-like [Phragmites australis]
METFGGASSRERQDKRRLLSAIVAWSCAMATVLALATVVPVAAREGHEAASTSNVAVVSRVATSAVAPPWSKNVTLICRSTPYPSACETALTSAEAVRSAGDPFAASVQFAMARATSTSALARNLSASARTVPLLGMHDCVELLDISLAQLGDALAGSSADADGATTWLSAALTNQGTCNDSLAAVPASAGRDALRHQVAALAQFISTALALHVNKIKGSSGIPQTSSAPAPSPRGSTFPSWLSERDKKLLEFPVTNITPDAVVALDSSGTHRSINEAIAAVTAAAPVGSEARGGHVVGGARRKVIHVKAGRYEESVSISYQQENVILMGDGKGKTIVDGHKSVADGYTTYSSATVTAMGSGFIAKGLSIVNSAGPGKGQAVALLVGGDRSVVYQCKIQAYQDTLFAHSNRQFYAEDDISGTVDFIFGNSAVVIQSCDIQARKPSPGQEDVITAQGRSDVNQNTGTSIHRCRITGASDLAGTPVYLGRPWHKYARTVVMESVLDGSIAPAGWLEWSDQSALGTVYYGEYENTGPGAATNGRVTWKGVHTSMSTVDAWWFTVKLLIQGDSWLGSTGVPYTSGL